MIIKRFLFGIWVVLWLCLICYGFGLLPRELKPFFNHGADWLSSTGTLWVFIDFRPGQAWLASLSLVGGFFLTGTLYSLLFVQNKQALK